jgi:hypothetical protein
MYAYNPFSPHNDITTVNIDISLFSPLNDKLNFYGIIIIIIIIIIKIALLLYFVCMCMFFFSFVLLLAF